MNAIEAMMDLLDKNGIEYWADSEDSPSRVEWMTDAEVFTARSVDGYKMEVQITRDMTPDQALSLTLGRGYCRRVTNFDGTGYVCSECGSFMGPQRWNFCPECGRFILK